MSFLVSLTFQGKACRNVVITDFHATHWIDAAILLGLHGFVLLFGRYDRQRFDRM